MKIVKSPEKPRAKYGYYFAFVGPTHNGEIFVIAKTEAAGRKKASKAYPKFKLGALVYCRPV